MRDQLISFDTAKLAKEKRFPQRDGDELYYFSKSKHINTPTIKWNHMDWIDLYIAPTQSLLQKWLREEHNCIVEISFNKKENENFLRYSMTVDYYKKDWSGIENDDYDDYDNGFDTYEEALEAGLLSALKLIQQ
jgi:hypothetical protein